MASTHPTAAEVIQMIQAARQTEEGVTDQVMPFDPDRMPVRVQSQYRIDLRVEQWVWDIVCHNSAWRVPRHYSYTVLINPLTTEYIRGVARHDVEARHKLYRKARSMRADTWGRPVHYVVR
jgi:hypothetical protein